ncbi:MAG TPA: hypothetical protein PKC21_10055 [Oligoflexia bacterium]|nr:hypothetical protein [Oligoflexia bacterium]HMR25683.1 hypothetical protein [Oligoflexia bacterium]
MKNYVIKFSLLLSSLVIPSSLFAGQCIIQKQNLVIQEEQETKRIMHKYAFENDGEATIIDQQSHVGCQALLRNDDRISESSFARFVAKYLPEKSECEQRGHHHEQVCTHVEDMYVYTQDFVYLGYDYDDEPEVLTYYNLQACGLTVINQNEFNYELSSRASLAQEANREITFVHIGLAVHQELYEAYIEKKQALDSKFKAKYISSKNVAKLMCEALADQKSQEEGVNVQWEVYYPSNYSNNNRTIKGGVVVLSE